MKEKIKALRLNVTISAVLNIVIGVLFIVFPAESIIAIGRVIAVIVILAGIAVVVAQMVEFGSNVMGVVVGAVISIIGIWMFITPAAIMTIIPIAIGVILVVHGIQDMSMAVEGARAHATRAWLPFVLAGINILLGFVCILNAFGFVSFAFVIIGIMLIWDGLTDLGIVHKVNKATNGVVDSTIISEEDIF